MKYVHSKIHIGGRLAKICLLSFHARKTPPRFSSQFASFCSSSIFNTYHCLLLNFQTNMLLLAHFKRPVLQLLSKMIAISKARKDEVKCGWPCVFTWLVIEWHTFTSSLPSITHKTPPPSTILIWCKLYIYISSTSSLLWISCFRIKTCWHASCCCHTRLLLRLLLLLLFSYKRTSWYVGWPSFVIHFLAPCM